MSEQKAPAKKQYNRKGTRLMFYIPDALYDQLKQLSEETYVPMSLHTRFALTEYMAKPANLQGKGQA